MELTQAISQRRMTRSFDPSPLDPDEVDSILDLARRAPSAGNTQAVSFLVLEGPSTAKYWDITLPVARRSSFRWQQLLDAPVLVMVCTAPSAYTSRYSEPDKARTGLGESTASWPVPYWWVDAGAVIQNLLLVATDRGLGACLFGPFENESALSHKFNLDPQTRIAATIAVGRPLPDSPGRSAHRPRPPLAAVVHRPPL